MTKEQKPKPQRARRRKTEDRDIEPIDAEPEEIARALFAGDRRPARSGDKQTPA